MEISGQFLGPAALTPEKAVNAFGNGKMPKGNVGNPTSSYGKTSFKAAEYHNQAAERRL
jgi:hypothetical protein